MTLISVGPSVGSSWLSMAVLAVLAIAPPARAASEIQTLIEMAETEPVEARRELCARIVSANPRPFAQLFCDGYEAIHRGLDEIAEIALANALEERPDFALAPILYADAYRARGDLARADAYYRRAIAIQPQRTDARFSLGQLLVERGRKEDPEHFKEALEVFRQMTQLDPRSTDGWANMAHVLVEMDRLDDAEQVIQRALSRDPSDPYLHGNLAAIYSRQGKTELAEAAWKRALSENRGYGPAVLELADLQGRSGRVVDAVRTLEGGSHAVQAPPWGARIRRNLGFAWLGLQEPERAADLFEEAAGSGDDALAFLGRGHTLLCVGDTDRGRAYLERGAAAAPDQAKPFLAAWPIGGGAPGPDRGARATQSLVSSVLEGWSFARADELKAQLLDPSEATKQSFDVAPVPIEQVAAIYPESAQEAGHEGQVVVRVSIDVRGKVTDAEIESSDATQELEQAALSAARRWVFQPATRFGNPVESTLTVPFRFTRRQ